ncbi:Rv0909 family putative TA system antitoxin [Patulibacter sp.]|uniref:Rv0909 family putative TA system antitoxin n=1 Tax=Patulibacter sp. TaxID=1912859 RepID=UPI002727834F|nr:Rv0909 family putative TA system antitoxin [Patulibacter sp.]MDO9410317.1 Rv0909 family putative TA system antitoxin [Patulibacter sp.]
MPDDHHAARLAAAIAGRQDGVISLRQLRWAGVSTRTLRRWVERGRIYRVGWRAYAFVPRVTDRGVVFAALLGAGGDRHLAREPTLLGAEEAAVRATLLDPHIVLSHYTALRLQGVCASAVTPVDVTFVGGVVRPRVAGVRGHRTRNLETADLRHVRGLPVTAVARALVEVAPRTPADRLRRLIREAQVLGALPPEELAAACSRLAGHPGVAVLAASDRDLAVRLTGDSPLAGDLAVFLERQTALAPWTPQHPVTLGRHVYRLDFARPDLRMAVEADGAGAHEGTQGRTSDARRDAEMLAHGWVTVRVTADRLRREPEPLGATLETIALQRGWRPGTREGRPASVPGPPSGIRARAPVRPSVTSPSGAPDGGALPCIRSGASPARPSIPTPPEPRMVNFSNLSKLADKAKSMAGQHNSKIDQAIDKGVKAADKATKGKYGDTLSSNAEKLKGAVDKVADKPGGANAPGTVDSTAVPAPAPDAKSGPVPDPDAPKGPR